VFPAILIFMSLIVIDAITINLFSDVALKLTLINYIISRITELALFNFIQDNLTNAHSFNAKSAIYLGLGGILLSAVLTKRTEFKQIFLPPLSNNLENDLEFKPESKTTLQEKTQKNVDSTSLIQKIIQLTPNIVYIYDLEKKCNIYSNSSIAEKLGYSDSEIESMNKQLFSKLLHPEDVKAIAKHQQDCLKLNPGEYLTIEYRMQDQQGDWHWLASTDTVFEQNDLGRPTQILGIAQDITEIKQHQLAASTLNFELATKVAALETWRDQHLKLAAMNEFLQACLTLKEAESALKDLLQPLFPNTHGAVYLMNNSKNFLEAIANWGIMSNDISFSFEPHECWALRKGDRHLAHPSTPGIYCSHNNHHRCHKPSLCLPMIAKSKTLGMLYLCFDSPEPISELIQELSATVAQNIAMSFASLQLQERLRYQSLRDSLTRLYNRRYLQESLAREIDRAQRKHQFIGIIMIDIDHFKKFNDVYGHAVGDLVLKEVGNYLLSQVRQYDTACRYGGEELVIVMPDASLENTVMRAEEIRKGIKQLKLEHDQQPLESITVSIGVSCFPDDGINSEQLIRAADKALYQAKAQGRDRVQRC
jgi:diguanylate cyclase (GGDEF)-like protein/PAS domain S-box-containing protein